MVIAFSAVVSMTLPRLMATMGTTEGGWVKFALQKKFAILYEEVIDASDHGNV
jgi:hypothetical protein